MSREEVNLITRAEIQQAIKMKGPVGWLVSTLAMQVMGLNKANRHYRRCAGGNTYDFSARIMKEFDIRYDLKEEQLEYIPREGPFLMLANHHFGGVDGMMVFDIIGHIRSDLYSVSTFLLGKVPEIKPSMFSVNPFTGGAGGGRSSLSGMRQALTHIRNGGCISLFPSGEVATYQSGKNRTSWDKDVIEDIPWPASIVKFIRMCDCPVLPVYFEGTCSKWFHRLGKIHPMLRTINLVNETMNKEGQTVPIRIGKLISVSEMNEYESLDDLYGFLRNRIYAMQAEFEPRALRDSRGGNAEPDTASIDMSKSRILFEESGFRCSLTDYPDYKQLLLWDTKEDKVAASWRIGVGSEISALFNFNRNADEVLPHCLELGRPFVSEGYQQDSLPQTLLFKGLMQSVSLLPEVRFLICPVSISSGCPKVIQSLMAWFFNEKYSVSEGYRIASPRTPFVPTWRNVRPDQLLSHTDTVEKFDRLIREITDDEYQLPAMVGKLFSSGGRAVCFGADPASDNSLNGLILIENKNE